MLYHYCDIDTAGEILRDGVIKANPIVLHRDMLGLDSGFTTTPIIWLSTNDVMEPTVVMKLAAAGIKTSICRFTLPPDYPAESLPEYADRMRISPEWWLWMITSGSMVGSGYETWRICGHSIPAKDWLKCEVRTQQGWQNYNPETKGK